MIDLALETPVLRAGYEYWNRIRGTRAMPSRADIDPAEIKSLLPYIILMDVLRRPDGTITDFRYRLIGTDVDANSSGRFTGRCFSEIPHQRYPSTLWRNLEQVATERRPYSHRVPYAGPHKEFLSVVDLVAPLSSDGETVDKILAMVDYTFTRSLHLRLA